MKAPIQFEYSLSQRSDIAAFLPKHYKTVLEIGCAKGGFIASLLPSVEVWGIEPNSVAALEATARGYKILSGLYEEVSDICPNAYFDVVVCNDVIEHMADHDKFLRDIKGKLAFNGCLVGSVPNVRYFGNLFKLLAKKDWKYEDQGVLDRTHLRFFTEKSLSRTFCDNGYIVNELRGINSDFSRRSTVRQFCKNALLMLVILMSFGSFRDARHVQIGFRITPTK